MLNYNGLNYLKKTIPPILKLNYPNYEFIIVDNGSTDSSVEFIKGFRKIKLIENKENLGSSKGRNLGAGVARGDYLLLLDSDILIEKKFRLQDAYKSYACLDNPAFMNFILINPEDFKKMRTKQYGGYYTLSGIEENRPVSMESIKNFVTPVRTILSHTGAVFIKKSVWDKLGGFDESQPFNLDDDDISLRASIFGYNNYVFTKCYYLHLGQERRANNKNYRWKYKYYFSGKLKAIIKNFEYRTMFFMIPLFVLKTLAKTIKQALFRVDFQIFYSLCYSIKLFFKGLCDTLDKRKIIQKNRKRRDEEIFKIKFPIKK